VLTLIRRREMEERQRMTDLKSAEKKGIQQGIQQGELHQKIAVVKIGIRQGVDRNLLSMLTGLSFEEIEAIRKDIENEKI
ncbi:MAG: hypothetical protein JW795_18520, partial [Chitinivibrionales bacterium]|nr:hypothetical protein [Chitinivibrionales bacterium]